RGTVAGSLAHADPASEWCAALLAADATVTARAAGQERVLGMGELLEGSFTTALGQNELIVEVSIPGLPPGWGLGFEEVGRRPGDCALALSAAAVEIADGVVRAARVVLGGTGGGVARSAPAEEALAGADASPSSWVRAAEAAAADADLADD